MKDDIADIKAIALQRLKSDPMVDAQKTLDEIKYSMALLEADLKGIEIDEEI